MFSQFPVEINKLIYDYRFGYLPDKHNPEFMAQTNNIKGVEWILKHKKWSLEEINTCLVSAATYGRLELVKILVANGADIHYDDDSAFQAAVSKNQLEVVKFLVSKGADIHVADDEAILTASMEGYTEIVKFLISKGANIHEDEDEALRFSSQGGHLEIVKMLIANGANVHTRDDLPIFLASYYNRLEVVKFLISKGANVRTRIFNESILLNPSREGYFEIVKVLVDNGADIRTDINKIIREARKNSHYEIVDFLVSKSAGARSSNKFSELMQKKLPELKEIARKFPYDKKFGGWSSLNKTELVSWIISRQK